MTGEEKTVGERWAQALERRSQGGHPPGSVTQPALGTVKMLS